MCAHIAHEMRVHARLISLGVIIAILLSCACLLVSHEQHAYGMANWPRRLFPVRSQTSRRARHKNVMFSMVVGVFLFCFAFVLLLYTLCTTISFIMIDALCDDHLRNANVW